MEFEDELKRALARREAPADFTQRVLARVCANERARLHPRWQWAAVAAAVVVLASGAVYEQYEHQVQGQAAKQKLLIAMRIAGSKLQQAQERVQEVESPEVQQ